MRCLLEFVSTDQGRTRVYKAVLQMGMALAQVRDTYLEKIAVLAKSIPEDFEQVSILIITDMEVDLRSGIDHWVLRDGSRVTYL